MREKLIKEVLISVDIEADGPIPGDYSMLAIGACPVEDPVNGFRRDLKPISDRFEPEALAVSGLDRKLLVLDGAESKEAMEQFEMWVQEVCGEDGRPILVSLAAYYDWMFTHWYFMHFLGRDPFGINVLDIKAYYAGAMRVRKWADTSKSRIDKRFIPEGIHSHDPLDDARRQAEMYRRIRHEICVE